jgi:hypothetical protein
MGVFVERLAERGGVGEGVTVWFFPAAREITGENSNCAWRLTETEFISIT